MFTLCGSILFFKPIIYHTPPLPFSNESLILLTFLFVSFLIISLSFPYPFPIVFLFFDATILTHTSILLLLNRYRSHQSDRDSVLPAIDLRKNDEDYAKDR